MSQFVSPQSHTKDTKKTFRVPLGDPYTPLSGGGYEAVGMSRLVLSAAKPNPIAATQTTVEVSDAGLIKL